MGRNEGNIGYSENLYNRIRSLEKGFLTLPARTHHCVRFFNRSRAKKNDRGINMDYHFGYIFIPSTDKANRDDYFVHDVSGLGLGNVYFTYQDRSKIFDHISERAHVAKIEHDLTINFNKPKNPALKVLDMKKVRKDIKKVIKARKKYEKENVELYPQS